jgi:hypothetical protein
MIDSSFLIVSLFVLVGTIRNRFSRFNERRPKDDAVLALISMLVGTAKYLKKNYKY